MNKHHQEPKPYHLFYTKSKLINVLVVSCIYLFSQMLSSCLGLGNLILRNNIFAERRRAQFPYFLPTLCGE